MRRASWVLVHALAAAGIAGSGLPGWLRLLLLGAVAAHWRLCTPAPAPLLLVTETGRWSVPGRGLYEVRAGPRSAYTGAWVRLVLGRGARAPSIVLLRPEYGRADWRRIQLAVRARAEPPDGPGGLGHGTGPR